MPLSIHPRVARRCAWAAIMLLCMAPVAGCSDDSSGGNNSTNNAVADDTGGGSDARDVGALDTNGPADAGQDAEPGDTSGDAASDAGDDDASGPLDCWEVGLTTDFYYVENGDELVKVSGDGTELSRVTVEELDPAEITFDRKPRLQWPFAVDEAASKFFWLRSRQYEEHFFQADLDGTNPSRISNFDYTSVRSFQQIPSNSTLYVLDGSLKAIRYDGTVDTDTILADPSSLPTEVANIPPKFVHVDVQNDTIYWGEEGTQAGNSIGAVFTTDLAGQNATLLDDDLWYIKAMAVAPEDNIIALQGGVLTRFITMELDGSNQQKYELPREAYATIRKVNMYASPDDDRFFWYDGETNWTVKYDGTGLAKCDGPQLILPN